MTTHQISLAGAQWRKSSHSNAGNQCVEVTQIGAVIAVRDSKDPDGGCLTFPAAEWQSFVDEVKRGNLAP